MQARQPAKCSFLSHLSFCFSLEKVLHCPEQTRNTKMRRHGLPGLLWFLCKLCIFVSRLCYNCSSLFLPSERFVSTSSNKIWSPDSFLGSETTNVSYALNAVCYMFFSGTQSNYIGSRLFVILRLILQRNSRLCLRYVIVFGMHNFGSLDYGVVVEPSLGPG